MRCNFYNAFLVFKFLKLIARMNGLHIDLQSFSCQLVTVKVATKVN